MSDDELGFQFEINAVLGDDLSDRQLNSLNNKIIKVLRDSIDIHGIALFNFMGELALVIAKNKDYFENLNQLGEIVGQLHPKRFFGELPDEIEYRGSGHMDFNIFEVHFAKIKENLIIAFIATDIHFQVFEHTREIIQSIKDKLLLDDEEDIQHQNASNNEGSIQYKKLSKDTEEISLSSSEKIENTKSTLNSSPKQEKNINNDNLIEKDDYTPKNAVSIPVGSFKPVDTDKPVRRDPRSLLKSRDHFDKNKTDAQEDDKSKTDIREYENINIEGKDLSEQTNNPGKIETSKKISKTNKSDKKEDSDDKETDLKGLLRDRLKSIK